MILRRFLVIFFRELYTRFAWGYDAVAQITSMGEWFKWQRAAYDALPGDPLLEIGCGTGHVQADLAVKGWRTVGIDRSPDMMRISSRRLRRLGRRPNLVQADARALPFRSACFHSAVSTFPSEYMFELGSLKEAHRVLQPDGRLVVVPMARITGRGLGDRLAGWLYHVTRQSGPIQAEWITVFNEAGFDASLETVGLARADVVRITAERPGPGSDHDQRGQGRPG